MGGVALLNHAQKLVILPREVLHAIVSLKDFHLDWLTYNFTSWQLNAKAQTTGTVHSNVILVFRKILYAYCHAVHVFYKKRGSAPSTKSFLI